MARTARKGKPTKTAAATLPEAPAGLCTPADAARAGPLRRADADLVVAARADAGTVFAFWEATASGIARARTTFDASARTHMALRVHVMTGRAGDVERRDLPVESWIGEARIPVDVPGARVVLALGLTDGVAFAHLARSRAVTLPTATPEAAGGTPDGLSIAIVFHRLGVGATRPPDGELPPRPSAARMIAPTLDALARVRADAVPFRLTLALSPVFAAQLPDEGVDRLRALEQSGHVELATTPATFADLNRLHGNAGAVRAQLAAAVAAHTLRFERAPARVWVPSGEVDAATLGAAGLSGTLGGAVAALEIERGGEYRANARPVYDPEAAHARAARDADAWLEATGPSGALVLDADHLGGRWLEGPAFLEALLRAAARRGIATGPAAAMPAWTAPLDPATDWTHRGLYLAVERMQRLAQAHPEAAGGARRALDQAARELLLAQAGDWPRQMTARERVDEAVDHLHDHLDAFFRLHDAVVHDAIAELGAWLDAREAAAAVLPGVDYRIYHAPPRRPARPKVADRPPPGRRPPSFGPEIY